MARSLFPEVPSSHWNCCQKFRVRDGEREGRKGKGEKGRRKEGSGWQGRAWPVPVYRSEDISRLVLCGDGTGGKKLAVARKFRLSHPKTTTVSETSREADRTYTGVVLGPK